MATISVTYQERRTNPKPFLILFLLALVSATVVGLMFSHGTAKHGASAETVRQCLDDKGQIRTYDLDYDKKARICEIEPGMFGIQIIRKYKGKWEEITAYVADQFNTLEQIDAYLRDMGYVLRWTK